MDFGRKLTGMIYLLIAAASLKPLTAEAQCCEPIGEFCGCGIELGADFILWKPCVGDLNYCAVIDNSNFKHKQVHLDWEPGVRVRAGKSNFFCGWDLKGSYTYLDAGGSSSSTTKNDNVIPTFSHNGFINNIGNYNRGKGEWESCYHEWDALASFSNMCTECDWVTYEFGLAGIYVTEDFSATLRKDDNRLRSKWDMEYWGVGFRMGLGYTKRVLDCIRFFATGHGTLLAGDAWIHTGFDSQDDDVALDHRFKEESFCQVVPGYHITSGFSYDTCLCNWDFSLRLGYEFLSWINLSGRRTYTNNSGVGEDVEAALSTPAATKTYGFHGLFAGLDMKF